ncbi:GH25 family lysozyme [Clostridium magnum]|uniref:GH25 family lysozyme n=1 Tax=Clostridium magnum TaxID=33954 RepID=UPI00091C70FC|nr:GH25 family lysozyme [Clostridium magnum]SHJ62809.1 lysozyme [Clostridium magnum DSM 2767]
MIKGIDIYEGDNIQDWNIVKQKGVEVVIQKATQGTSHVDSLLKYRYPKIKQAGLKIGFYHFAQFNSVKPIAEAQHFLSTISGLESDTVLWLDIEAAEKWDKQIAINYANTFIDYIKNLGHKVGIYTGDSFYHEYLEGNIPEIPLWLASYGRQPSLYPSNASWQYSESGRLDGIVGNVDLDYFIDNIFISKPVSPGNCKLKVQIQALEYWLNVDYNAKLKHTDGTYLESELYPNLEAVGKLLVKGHKSHLVQWIQQKLEMYGYLKAGSYTPMLLDEPTFQAVTNLQKKWGRETSGKILISNRTWQIFLEN